VDAAAGRETTPRLLHDILFLIVEEVCWDADYLYRSFTCHFSGLMSQIYDTGGSASGGSYTITGVKSGRIARITWSLQHRLDFHGPNQLRLEYEIADETPGASDGGSILAELGTGRVLESDRRRRFRFRSASGQPW
jgi:hypothetical protein